MRPTRFEVVGAIGLATAMAAGCAHREPPAPDASPSVAAPDLPATAAGSLGASRGAGGASSNGAPALVPPVPPSTPAAAASPDAPPAAGAVLDAAVDPATLPQTRDRPSAGGPDFDARVAALWRAIVADDPPQALPFFFPLAAYRQVKDVPDPAADWKHRLVAAYSHDIHALHRRLGDDATRAKFVSIDVPDAHGRWVEPGEEYNKIGYYRVFGSRLRWEIDGAPHSADVKSLISWRGQWYVVHLSAIQ